MKRQRSTEQVKPQTEIQRHDLSLSHTQRMAASMSDCFSNTATLTKNGTSPMFGGTVSLSNFVSVELGSGKQVWTSSDGTNNFVIKDTSAIVPPLQDPHSVILDCIICGESHQLENHFEVVAKESRPNPAFTPPIRKVAREKRFNNPFGAAVSRVVEERQLANAY